MTTERRAINLTLDQAVTLTHFITNVRSNPSSLRSGCCLDPSRRPVEILHRLAEIAAELETVVTFDDSGPRWTTEEA